MLTINTPIEQAPKIRRSVVPALKHLGIKNIRDLLFHFPARYEDFSNLKPIGETSPGEVVTVQGRIKKITSYRSSKKHIFITEAIVEDNSGTIRATWFNQSFLSRNFRTGLFLNLSGKAMLGPRGKYLQNPAYEKINRSPTSDGKSDFYDAIHTGGLIAMYPETKGITSRWLRFLIKSFIGFHHEVADPLPIETRQRHGLLEIKEALYAIHFPRNLGEAEKASWRFSFQNLFFIQLSALREKLRLKQHPAPAIALDLSLIKKFVSSLPYDLTNAQRRSIWEIAQDLAKPRPMNRLLEGDVGSGKTVVAAAASLLCAASGFKTAFMAPTEILANQHFATLQKILTPFEIKIGLLTSSNKKISGNPEVIVGTHALIQKGVNFENLGLVVVDEQHRFGVEQRATLIRSQTTNISESTKKNKIVEKELSYKLVGVFFEVQKEIGRFCRERQYADLLEKKLKERQIDFKREYPVEVGDRKSNFVDFIIEGKVLVDLKAKPFIEKVDYFQIKRYLEVLNLELGLVVNFQDRYLKPKRILAKSNFVDSDELVASDRCLPHFLSMSATPIPRTLALTIYGDLDLSILDEMPKSRKIIITKIVEPSRRAETYRFIRDEVRGGRQAFVICPRIEAPDPQKVSKTWQQKLLLADVKAVKEEYEKLSKEIFPDLKVSMLHGKMPAKGGSASGGKSKEEVMKDFNEGKIDILVSTSVVEVGMDVPNATIMMIEGAECFGLATLHQFRGRVGRGADQSYCFLFPSEDGLITKRLRAVVEAKNGFELAEKDLAIRGPGDILGTRQWGISSSMLSALSDPKLVREVRKEAAEILKKSPSLKIFPALENWLEGAGMVHPE